eukprot:Opistho-2@52444
MHKDMFAKASAERKAHTKIISEWKEFVPALDGKNLVLAPWCEAKACEEEVKKRSTKSDDAAGDASGAAMGAKSLCIPFEQPKPIEAGQKCFQCGGEAHSYTLFGRSY